VPLKIITDWRVVIEDYNYLIFIAGLQSLFQKI
jgi:hypothetical protein